MSNGEPYKHSILTKLRPFHMKLIHQGSKFRASKITAISNYEILCLIMYFENIPLLDKWVMFHAFSHHFMEKETFL